MRGAATGGPETAKASAVPESNGPLKLTPQTLSEADASGSYVRVRCHYCTVTYYYRPIDLAELVGDGPCSKLVGKMRCTRCGRGEDTVDVRVVSPIGDDLRKMRVRRLAGVRTVRLPIWRDEPS
jgi:hypothetical protein